MSVTREQLQKRIAVAAGRELADVVLKNGRILDVFSGELFSGDVAIADGCIVGIGEYEGQRVIDASNQFIVPSFIDGHVHIESSMVSPSEFAKAVIPHGVTTIVTDPHEIANVAGIEGLTYMLEDSEGLPVDMLFMLPSCVPATSFEHNGATLTAVDLAPFFSHPRVLGLAEVMDYPAVQNGNLDMIEKLHMTLQAGALIDGHGAGLNTKALNIYRAVSIGTDHECVTAQEARERVQRGMYVMLRQGSGAKNLLDLLPAVNAKNAHRFLFCTDDKHLDELIDEGSIDHSVRLAIHAGLSPITAIQMASLHAAQCFGLKMKGAVAPGYEADLLLLNSLEELEIAKVIKAGHIVAENGAICYEEKQKPTPPPRLLQSVRQIALTEAQLQIPIGDNGLARIIGVIPNQLVTKELIEPVQINEGLFVPSVRANHVKLAVLERHQGLGTIGLGIVKGLKLSKGAIASTVAHDSHNLVVAGTNDQDMLLAIAALQEMNGGLVVVCDGDVIGNLSLSIGGLMSQHSYREVYSEMHNLHQALHVVAPEMNSNLFLTLSFLSLPVIPELKLTDTGLFHVGRFTHVKVAVDQQEVNSHDSIYENRY